MIQKVERQVTDYLKSYVMLEKAHMMSSKWMQSVKTKGERLILNWNVVLLIVGFLLGRAMILEEMTPFALPFFAAVYALKREKSFIVLIAVIGGALSNVVFQSVFMLLGILIFLISYRLIVTKEGILSRRLAVCVFVSSVLSRCLLVVGMNEPFVWFNTAMIFVEAGLSTLLTLIFLQSVPLITVKKKKNPLRTEELVSFLILLASIMTGTIGWVIQDVSIENIVSRYFVLLFSFVSGAAIGSTVGVVIGLILGFSNITSLYQMSLLAFSGLLGGLLKDGKKVGVSFGLIIGTLLIGLYSAPLKDLQGLLIETGIAIILFMLTPKSLMMQLSRYVPGTNEYAAEQQQYLRKIRDVTAQRIEQFSSLFHTLSNSFQEPTIFQREWQSQREVDLFLSEVTKKSCQTCFRNKYCWAKNSDTTYELMKDIMTQCEEHSPGRIPLSQRREWDKHCIKPDRVINVINDELGLYKANQELRRQVFESRRLVADQLKGVSQVMGNFAKEIQKERENLYEQEEEIYDQLQDIGIEIEHIEIYNLTAGNIDIEMTMYYDGYGEAEKVIAPILSNILDETIVVKRQDRLSKENGLTTFSFGSTKAFVVETGIASAAKGGALVSGDSYSTIELGAGKYAIAISDGMGNGERAHIESNETIRLLQKILQSGIEEKVAIKSVNSVLSLRTNDEVFSTLDLAMIDLHHATAKFLKIGSIPSFIKRSDKIMMVEANNLPMGVFEDVDVDVVSAQLKAGDLLIMMSDGIFDGPKFIENKEVWLKRKLREIETDDPQAVADLIMEEVIRSRGGQIEDDMTVVVTKIKRNTPKWASIPIYGKSKKKAAL